MGAMKNRALALAQGIANMPMDTFDRSKYSKPPRPVNETLEHWIEEQEFDPDNELALVDLPDAVPESDQSGYSFACMVSQRYNQYGRKTFLTPDQLRFLNRLIDRYCK